MYRLIATFLDYEIGPDLFDDGVVELKLCPQDFVSEEAALKYIQSSETKRIKKECAYEGAISADKVETKYSFDGQQAYIDVRVDLGAQLGICYFGRYIYRVVEVK